MTQNELKGLVDRSHAMTALTREISRQLRQLDENRARTEEEIASLKKRNLANLVGQLLGRTGKRLREKKLELYMMEKKREELTYRLEAVEEERTACEQVLALAADRKEDTLLFRLENRKKDIAGAIRQGESARDLCKGLRNLLEQAREYGVLDAQSRSHGADEAKHAKLDDVRSVTQHLGRQLDELEFALEPLGENLDIGQLPEVKHVLNDGLILEWILLKKIDDALEQVKDMGRYLSETLRKLERLQESLPQENNFVHLSNQD